jgi:hypothetical protein
MCACGTYCACAVGLVLAAQSTIADVVMAVRDWPGRSARSTAASGAGTGRHPPHRAVTSTRQLNLAHPDSVGSVHQRYLRQARHHR